LLENKRAADRGQDRLALEKLEEQARLARRKKGRIDLITGNPGNIEKYRESW